MYGCLRVQLISPLTWQNDFANGAVKRVPSVLLQVTRLLFLFKLLHLFGSEDARHLMLQLDVVNLLLDT